jgi:hypothetical protein
MGQIMNELATNEGGGKAGRSPSVRHVRDRVVAALNTRFQSDVDLELLQISVFPRPEISGEGLTLRHNGRTDVNTSPRYRSFRRLRRQPRPRS